MYFIHLSKENTAESLSLEEIQALGSKDPELVYTTVTEYKSPSGETIQMGGNQYLKWVPVDRPELTYWFIFTGEDLMTIYDSLTLWKFREIARELDCVVYGDVGEEY